MTGEELTRIRAELGLNQETLAKFIGVNPTTISNYEAGKRPIPLSVEKLLRIIAILLGENP